jgi:hypothetical protein
MTPSAHTAGGRRVRRWTRELIIEKIREWEARYGEPPCSADWNPSLAKWRAQEWRAERYRDGVWPSTNAAKRPFAGSFDAAIRAAGLEPRRPGPKRAAGVAGPVRNVAEGERVSDRLAGETGFRQPTVIAAEDLAVALDRGDCAEALERLEAVIADANARVRASDDQAQAAVRDAAEARRALAAAQRRVRELSARLSDGHPRLTAEDMSVLRNGGGPTGPAVLAAALRRLAKARAAGDRSGLRIALGEVASAAVRWHDRL